ncbi:MULTISPECIES: SGNH/GDSL hydrolase family protein [Halocynthiibacter]|uniref:SGNH/GDSL hydrolase family protein n=1 Tax=Halocynthiibacter halioticoli TaxID=2986804 RepID=A0AAE3IX78_9RHOB|nr:MULTISPECIES: SGNH/GDSL hydrolase family protein [Halocynthiibacter]MCV6823810.1 SGNH/GDSL hydrolase family protein [Halocynthiibacter halioticoli]MCW4056811.1 SGNH/GDSL hydrolase family protein [Halocynthiibacter sp. SDUM655004]
MTRLLTFGDSNTHGTLPKFADDIYERLAPEERWTGIVQAELGCDLIEEGLPGRTAATPDPDMGAHMDGRLGLAIALNSHGPLDVMTLMLGTNDVKTAFGLDAKTVASHIEGLVDYALSEDIQKRHSGFKILLIAPPPVRETGFLKEKFRDAEPKSRALTPLLQDLASAKGIEFLDGGKFVDVSPIDGVHYGAEMHTRLGLAVAAKLATM